MRVLARFVVISSLLVASLTACGRNGPAPENADVPVSEETPSDTESSPADESTPADEGASEPASFTIVSMNDTYRMGGLLDGTGGFARVAGLRAALEAEGRAVLVTHAGDFLSPSMESREFHGAQMVDVFNHLDNDGAAFDDRFVVTFGNHEFDLRDPAELDQRLTESQFTWLNGNIRWAEGEAGPAVEAPNTAASWLQDLNGVRVGVFGITTNMKTRPYIAGFDDYEDSARRLTAELRAQGAEFVVAVTHLAADEDVALLEALGDQGPDLVLGGHDHDAMTENVDGRFMVKADADNRSVTVTTVQRDADGSFAVDIDQPLIDTLSPWAPSPAVLGRVLYWEQAFDQSFCIERMGATRGCLAEPLGASAGELVGEELEIRKYETNLGNWLTDRMLEVFADRGAQLAFYNSGSIRLNQNVPAGPVSRRILEECFAYPVEMVLVELDGATLANALRHGVADWTGSGRWFQVAGMAFRHLPESEEVTDLTLLTPEGPRPIAPDEKLLAVTTSYVHGSDEYPGLKDAAPILARYPLDLKEVVVGALGDAGDVGISPRVEGRICNAHRLGPCLAVSR